jgi:hypothetical protein
LICEIAYGDGGAIYAQVNVSMTCTSCRFDGNAASSQGGALYLNSAKATIEVNSFTSNYAYQGGCIFVGEVLPSALYMVVIVSSRFLGNGIHRDSQSLAAFGGVLYISGEGAIVSTSQSVFARNQVTLYRVFCLDIHSEYILNIAHAAGSGGWY